MRQANSIPHRPRRPNGATQTFRRSSASTSMSSINQPQDPSSAQAPPRYVPPHRNGTVADTRYSKDQLLDLFKAQQMSEGGLRDGLPSLYVGGWQPDISNGSASAGWGRPEHSRDGQPGPDICWDRDGTVEPLGLVDMDSEERDVSTACRRRFGVGLDGILTSLQLFLTSVNTPLKPPSTANKENQASNGVPGRKISLSGQTYSPGAFGPLSPTASRAPGRRRDTSESYPFPSTNPLASPTGGFNREDQRAPSPPPSLTRRRTDLKDLNKVSEKDGDGEEKSTASPFGSLRRNPTGPLSSGFGAPASPWSNAPQSAGLSPMGSFGSFGLGQQAPTIDKRPGLGSGRAESRFKNLLNKDSTEDSSTRSVERKASLSSLSRVNENESWRPQPAQEPSTAPVDEVEEDFSSGTGPDADINPQHHYQATNGRGFGTPSRVQSRDDYGFGAFGMTSDTSQGFGQGFLQGQHAYQQTPAQQPRHIGGHEPMSPTDTNPYKSPEQHGIDRLTGDMEGDQDDMHAHLPGLGGFGGDQHQQLGGLGGFGNMQNLGRAGGPQGAASDRSQTSSAAGNRGFPGLGGLGQMAGHPGAGAWPPSQGAFGTPGRPNPSLSNAFGGGIFATSMAEMQSPGLAGLGSPGVFGPQSATALGGRSGLFSPASQEQMRQADQQRDLSGDRSGQPGYSHPSDPFGGQHDPETQGDASLGQFGPPGQHPAIGQASQQQGTAAQAQQQGGGNQPPAPQQRTMVMPDRMRWIYKDPSGNMQGPWTGLEMHDWYKAGFFSPELLVKKYEDPDYEPLAQLIRRIGNSREPFLVPQIGIPYGQNTGSSAAPSTWTGTPSTTSTGPTSTGAQPPFASSFPSFGTTLTAEQQNALERRKQEEQYLMARQKEHLAQQQIAQRMQHQQHGMPGAMGQTGGLMPGASQLHHHSSAQSLHSQPSFGSMTSPPSGPFQPSPTQGAQGQGPGFFDQAYRSGQAGGLGAVGAGVDSLGHIREEEIPGIMDRLNLGNQTQGQFGAPGQPFAGQIQSPSAQEQHDRQVQQVLQDRARLQQEQAAHDAQQAKIEEQPTQNERLQQFKQLQGQGPASALSARFQPALDKASSEEPSSTAESSVGSPAQQLEQQEMSLKERIQQTQSAQQSPAPQQPGLPDPFPPAPSQSPLPAPAAQRTGRTSVADQLQTEQRDLSQTPSVETPSAAVAPWAKEPTEAQKGPSLKEIQAMEAKKAAEQEEMAAANRRAAFQREMEAQAQAATTAPAPGLPASASWGAAAGSPATPTGATASAWAKAAQKPTAPATTKSMAQIQKEEEARKRKLAAAAAQAQATNVASISATVGGKSYANLAGKISAPAPAANPNAPGGAWTTVGAGGKPKTPAAPPAAPAPTRSASTTIPSAPAAAAARKAPSRASTMNTAGGVNAQDEFKKWAIGELRPDLNKGYSGELPPWYPFNCIISSY